MKNCNKIHPLLPLYREGQLTAGENNLIAAHLKDCGQARVELAELERIRLALQAMPDPKMPSDLHSKIMARLGGDAKREEKRRSVWVLPSWGLATAAALTFVLLSQDTNWRGTFKFDPKVRTNGELKAVGEAKVKEEVRMNAPQAFAPAQPESTSSVPRVLAQKADEVEKGPAAYTAGSDQKTLKQKKAAVANRVDQTYSMAEGETVSSKAEAPAEVNEEKDLGGNETQPAAAPAQTRSLAKAVAPSVAVSEPMAGAPVAQSVAPAVDSMNRTSRKVFSASPLWSGNNGYSDEEFQALVTDDGTFAKYWKGLVGEQTMPTVDFSQQAVVVLMAGTKPTPGYFIHFVSMEEKVDEDMIHYSVTSPAPDAVLAQVLSHPWSMQVVRKPLKTVVFVKD